MPKPETDKSLLIITGFSMLIVIADQITKYLAVCKLKALHSVEVIPGFFNLSYVENDGAAWGILSGQRLALIIFSIISLGFILWKRKQLFGHLRFSNLVPILICGGIIGNLIDRIHLSRVIDFLDFHAGGKHFPSFNIADSAICIGAFIFILSEFFHNRKVSAKQKQEEEPETP